MRIGSWISGQTTRGVIEVVINGVSLPCASQPGSYAPWRPSRGAEQVQSRMTKPISVFLSFSQRDEEFARKLAADLEADGYFKPLLGVTESMNAGERWETPTKKTIESSAFFLVLISSASVKSPSVILETQIAMSCGKCKVIPARIENAGIDEIPNSVHFLRELQWIDLHTHDLYASNLASLSTFAGSVAPAEPVKLIGF